MYLNLFNAQGTAHFWIPFSLYCMDLLPLFHISLHNGQLLYHVLQLVDFNLTLEKVIKNLFCNSNINNFFFFQSYQCCLNQIQNYRATTQLFF